jgi:ABC-type phosphate transport system substrate-binding protein
MKTLLTLTLVSLAAIAAAGMSGSAGVAVAIIVNKNNPVDSVPVKQLKQYFSGDKSRWPNGDKVHTMATGAATPEHKVAIPFLFGMDEAEYQKYCIHANFVGTPQIFPADFGSSATVIRFVSTLAGGIGFVNGEAVTPAVKVLKIDGKAPGEPGYPITGK